MSSIWLAFSMLTLLSLTGQPCQGFTSSEQGVKEAELNSKTRYLTFTKSLYKNAEVMIHILCTLTKSNATTKFRISWMLRQSPCAEEYSGLDADPRRAPAYFNNPEAMQVKEFTYQSVKVQFYPDRGGLSSLAKDDEQQQRCLACQTHSSTLLLPNVQSRGPVVLTTKQITAGSAANLDGGALTAGNVTAGGDQGQRRRNRRVVAPAKVAAAAAAAAPVAAKPTAASANATAASAGRSSKSGAADRAGLVTRTWEDGVYLLVLRLDPCCGSDVDPIDCPLSLLDGVRVTARIEIVNTFGYLSAIDWPLLPFFGSMCLLYLLFGLLWLSLCARYWREMLRIQFCISGVIFLGMLEKALFYAEYQSINSTGVSVRGAVMLAELVSCVKRSVARMLVLIVCLGYGIVKPRLGQLQHKVIAIGLVYFVFSAVESSLRSMRPRFNQSRNAFYATIPLAVTDAIICWWIFSSLVQTIRNLRVRRNLVKLSLYRHFTNTLVFCVVCSVVFMAWTVGRHKFAVCVTAWRELWIDDAFWHLLFSVILFVIIVLWRPSQNNQRYAFTPLLDTGNDSDAEDDEEVIMDNLAEGVKARGQAAAAQHQHQQQQRSRNSSKGEDSSLRWVEENIPQSLVESTLPSLLHDSDEEVLTTKYEMSKLL